MTTEKAWDTHYTRDRSVLHYPDENLVRMLKGALVNHDPAGLRALDAGCGTGRHLRLLKELGVGAVLGADLSANALETCEKTVGAPVMLADLKSLPMDDNAFDIVISWGSLHYCDKSETGMILGELRRVLKPGGLLLGTLRGARDTFLRRLENRGSNTWLIETADLKNSVVSFFNEEELPVLFAEFSVCRFGVMERSLLGRTDRLISHWFFQAEK